MVDLPPGMTKDVNITVKGGNENCSLKLSPSPAAKAYSFPYVNRVTPVHGIYVASFTIIFIGGVWACRKLRNRGRAGGARVAYQQLEMSSERPPATLTNDDRVDGWDEHWSDDWDEEEALPRPSEGGGGGGRPVKSSSDRNEWEDWDD
ncbi:unnamed protein product [Spirodela intermedia]|uniref:Uncharacterized protein n=1 Tax=Spirodela intermedia TaxID=51605 RepID=A0A7I8L829_SPIIN|nr:unnamed protein product [Spirodela intermedia]